MAVTLPIQVSAPDGPPAVARSGATAPASPDGCTFDWMLSALADATAMSGTGPVGEEQRAAVPIPAHSGGDGQAEADDAGEAPSRVLTLALDRLSGGPALRHPVDGPALSAGDGQTQADGGGQAAAGVLPRVLDKLISGLASQLLTPATASAGGRDEASPSGVTDRPVGQAWLALAPAAMLARPAAVPCPGDGQAEPEERRLPAELDVDALAETVALVLTVGVAPMVPPPTAGAATPGAPAEGVPGETEGAPGESLEGPRQDPTLALFGQPTDGPTGAHARLSARIAQATDTGEATRWQTIAGPRLDRAQAAEWHPTRSSSPLDIDAPQPTQDGNAESAPASPAAAPHAARDAARIAAARILRQALTDSAAPVARVQPRGEVYPPAAPSPGPVGDGRVPTDAEAIQLPARDGQGGSAPPAVPVPERGGPAVVPSPQASGGDAGGHGARERRTDQAPSRVAITRGPAPPVIGAPAVPPVELPVVSPVAPAGSAPAGTASDTGDVPRQVVRAIHLQWRQGIGEARLQLQPEHLGHVTVSLKIDRGVLSATLRAETLLAREQIQAHQRELRDSLEAQGLRVADIVVEVDPDGRRRQEQDPWEPAKTPRPPRRPSGATFELPD